MGSMMVKNNYLKYIGLLAFSACIYSATASETSILSFENGTIVWTNAGTQGVVTVEWASSLDDTWANSWSGLRQQTITGSIMSARMPMFFRVMTDPVDISWVTIGNPQNPSDSTGYGSVNYTFRMSKYEINNFQYTDFLNSVDPDGMNTLGLYNAAMGTDARGGITRDTNRVSGSIYLVRANMFDKPVIFVNFWDALRF